MSTTKNRHFVRWPASGLVVLMALLSSCSGRSSGPVVPVVFDSPTSGLPHIAVDGKVELRDGCLYLESDRNPSRPIIWPAGTTWNDTDQTIVLPGGTTIELDNPTTIVGLFADDETVLWPEITRLKLANCDLADQEVLVAVTDLPPVNGSSNQFGEKNVDVASLNKAVKAFISEWLTSDGIQIEHSVGIAKTPAGESDKVVVAMSSEARRREEIALLEEQLRAFVEAFLAEASDSLALDDYFEIQTREIEPPGS